MAAIVDKSGIWDDPAWARAVTDPDDHPAFVDIVPPAEGSPCARQLADVVHDPVFPEKTVDGQTVHARVTGDLARVVDTVSPAVRPAERSQVGHLAVFPQERVDTHPVRRIGMADDLTELVDSPAPAIVVPALQRAEVDGGVTGVGKRRDCPEGRCEPEEYQ